MVFKDSTDDLISDATEASTSSEFERNNTPMEAPIVAACRHLLKPNGSVIGDEVAEVLLPRFPDLCSALPADSFPDHQALLGIGNKKQKPLTQSRVRDFILSELGPQLQQLGCGRGDRIALVLPNGPELALAILGISHWASCLPLNANGAPSELKKDLQAANTSLIIAIAGEESRAIQDIAQHLAIPFCGLRRSISETGIFSLDIDSFSVPASGTLIPNNHDCEVLVLFTSGTTGNKKLVPHRLGDMLIAAACIALSWNLTPKDINCNLMPLFHVGGIVRQVFSPILSAGSVICCPSFDPAIFWELLLQKETIEPNGIQTKFTWYYAAPTMHQILLETLPAALDLAKARHQCKNLQPRLRMIANAAGGLLPSLAEEMRSAFGGANILPSYGMTECMPISSPPYDYELTKPGTSGVAVGPQVGIFNASNHELAPGQEGSICVRGRPTFYGYGNRPNGEGFHHGWFNTGDLGYLDAEGYLYITGRSKEVINRGGEIISPMEIEEEVRAHPSVAACAAFSTKHDVLQETVGIVVVPSPRMLRIDLETLHDFLESRLTPAKWPQVLVFMNALPKSHTNKLLRVKLGERLGLPEMNDEMQPIERTFEAQCPPQGTPVAAPISCTQIIIDATQVEQALLNAMCIEFGESQLIVTNHPHRNGSLVVHAQQLNQYDVIKTANDSLHAYLRPMYICLHDNHYTTLKRDFCESFVPKATDLVGCLQMTKRNVEMESDPVVEVLQEIVQDLVDYDCLPSPDISFFRLGGTSLLASQLASKIRKRFQVSFSGADVFLHNSCLAMAKKIKSKRNKSMENGREHSTGSDKLGTIESTSRNFKDFNFDGTKLLPRKNLLKTLFQLLPAFVVFPWLQFTRVFLFFTLLLEVLKDLPWERNIIRFITTIVAFNFLWNAITPLIFVLIKWVVIGKYKAGRYPFWSSYYLRWWFVDVCRKIFGKGIWSASPSLLIRYYRMLGANIALDARIAIEAEIAEFDLVTIGRDASIEYSTVRGFGVDNGAMQLGPVRVGSSASVGIRSVVAPCTTVPNGSHVAPATSSYEITRDSNQLLECNRYSEKLPGWALQTFIGSPIKLFIEIFSHIPDMYIIYVMMETHVHKYEFGNYNFETLGDLLEWLCDPVRVPYFLAIRIARSTVAPFLYMIAALFVKTVIIGKFRAGPRDPSSQWDRMRVYLAASIFSRSRVQAVTDLLGRHYSLTSAFYRLLGAKVGKRVFWPGTQPLCSGIYDLLEIGDDVVFGSRSTILCTSSQAYEKVRFCAGANISDNAVVLPGSIVGKNAVLGSNTVCPHRRFIPPSSTWLGSKGGEPVLLKYLSETDIIPQHSLNVKLSDIEMDGDSTTIRPFGRAVYLQQANYFVFPGWMMSLLHVGYEALLSCFHSIPLIGTIYISVDILYGWERSERDFDHGISPLQVYITMFGIYSAFHFARILVGMIVEISAKWFFLGRRQMGRYNWHESSYNQRWELYQLATKIRKVHKRSALDFFAGTPFIDWYFRALGGTIGRNCCLYPAGGDPYMPEPDLVRIGDYAAVDMASIVCHLNTQGNFELVPIRLEANATLRARSRVQQGVRMQAGAMILEKSLALTGEVVESRCIWQGSPAESIAEYDEETDSERTDETLSLLLN